MQPEKIHDLSNTDYERPIQLTKNIWWVGHYQPEDNFQCHAYFIAQGEESVLIDPGSMLNFPQTLAKIEKIMPFECIRYFVCQHQDPDITASMQYIDKMPLRRDAVLVTHWRAEVLIKHYGLKIPFWRVEEHDWKLKFGDKTLEFHFTPYLHFPGAFCTFDPDSGILFSSDIFGGFTKEWTLVAQDEGYFEQMRPFHEHYMPNREILQHSLLKLEKLPIRLIAPQHGSLIPQDLIPFIINKLKALDCGLYLLAQRETDIKRLVKVNEVLKDVAQTMILYRDFRDIARTLHNLALRLIPISALEFYSLTQSEQVLHFSPVSRYRGIITEEIPSNIDWLGKYREEWDNQQDFFFSQVRVPGEHQEDFAICLPLFAPEQEKIHGMALLRLDEEVEINEGIIQLLQKMSLPLEVALERESILRMMDLEYQQIYKRAMLDPLTGLYNRTYMEEALKGPFALQDRSGQLIIVLLLIDLDHFKLINDIHGHIAGDEVLRQLGELILENTRTSDIPVRLGGDEFALFLIGEDEIQAKNLASRLRDSISELQFDFEGDIVRTGFSAGVAFRQKEESLIDLIKRTDKVLYEAKNSGRNLTFTAE